MLFSERMPRTNAKSQDVRLKELEMYVGEGKYADSVLEKEKRGLRLVSKNFTMIGKFTIEMIIVTCSICQIGLCLIKFRNYMTQFHVDMIIKILLLLMAQFVGGKGGFPSLPNDSPPH